MNDNVIPFKGRRPEPRPDMQPLVSSVLEEALDYALAWAKEPRPTRDDLLEEVERSWRGDPRLRRLALVRIVSKCVAELARDEQARGEAVVEADMESADGLCRPISDETA